MRKTVLFFCQQARDRVVAERLAAQLPGYACILAGHVRGQGYFIRFDDSADGRQLSEGAKRGLLGKIRQKLLRRSLPEYFAYQMWKREADCLFNSAKIDVVILFQESVGDTSQIVGSVATKRSIPYIILPQTIPNPEEQAAFYGPRLGRDGNSLAARVVTAIWPRWGYVYRGHRLLYSSIGGILAQRFAGLWPKTPWIPNSGNAELICIECKSLDALYRALGFSSRQRLVCGHPVDDTLYAVQRERSLRRTALAQRLGLDARRPLVVVGFPPDQYTSPDTSRFEWPNFEAMARAWCDALDLLKTWASVVICPHPRLEQEKLRVVSERGFPLSPYLTEEVVPLADLYVASISATIRWALACGVPVLNYDCYRYRYHDYDSAAGIATVEDWNAFRQACLSVSTASGVYETMKARAESDLRNWGEIDGGFVTRFVGVLERVGGVCGKSKSHV